MPVDLSWAPGPLTWVVSYCLNCVHLLLAQDSINGDELPELGPAGRIGLKILYRIFYQFILIHVHFHSFHVFYLLFALGFTNDVTSLPVYIAGCL